jgi:hypothetical protein
MSIAVPAVPSGGGAIVTFMAFSAVIGIDNPLDVLAYTMTVDWLMSDLINFAFNQFLINNFISIGEE